MAERVEIQVTLDTAAARRESRRLRDEMRGAEDEARGTAPGRGEGARNRPARRTGRRGARAGPGPRGRAASGAARGAPAGAARGAAAGGAAGRFGAARAAVSGAAATGAAAVAGGIAIQQAVGRGAAQALETFSLLVRTQPEAFRAVITLFTPEIIESIVNSPQFAQVVSDEALALSDEIIQKFTFEGLRSQTARLDIVDILGPFARAGLPSGSLGGFDGSFTENLVRKRRRDAFLERQEARRKQEGAILFLVDAIGAFMGG